jgi:hypothetical protein
VTFFLFVIENEFCIKFLRIVYAKQGMA